MNSSDPEMVKLVRAARDGVVVSIADLDIFLSNLNKVVASELARRIDYVQARDGRISRNVSLVRFSHGDECLRVLGDLLGRAEFIRCLIGSPSEDIAWHIPEWLWEEMASIFNERSGAGEIGELAAKCKWLLILDQSETDGYHLLEI